MFLNGAIFSRLVARSEIVVFFVLFVNGDFCTHKRNIRRGACQEKHDSSSQDGLKPSLFKFFQL